MITNKHACIESFPVNVTGVSRNISCALADDTCISQFTTVESMTILLLNILNLNINLLINDRPER